MKLVYCHGMSEEDRSAQDLLNDWNSHLFGKSPVANTAMCFWGDLSVVQTGQLTLSVEDLLLCELYKISTDNHFLGDCHSYFYDADHRGKIRARFISALGVAAPKEPIVVLTHSLGTVIGYDVLKDCPDLNVIRFITVGSPLGMECIKGELKRIRNMATTSQPDCVQEWLNISDPSDIVAIKHDIQSGFLLARPDQPFVQDVSVINPASPQHPHSIDGYLQTSVIKEAVSKYFKVD